MKLIYSAIVLTFLLSINSCNQTNEIKAKIIERTIVSKEDIKLKFKYQIDSKEYVDSFVVKNNVIKEDTFNVLVEKSHPDKAISNYK